MSALLADPLIQTALLPFLAAALAALVLTWPKHGRSLAAGAIGLGFLAAAILVVGIPDLPPKTGLGKLFWAAPLALLLGWSLDATGRAALGAKIFPSFLAAVGLWIAVPILKAPAAGEEIKIAFLAAGLGLAAWRLPKLAADQSAPPTDLGLMALGGAATLGALALIGASASVAQLSFALAAAIGGFLILNWPKTRHRFAASGLFAAFVPLLGLVVVAVLFSRIRSEALLIALPILVADKIDVPVPGRHPALAAVRRGVAVFVPAGLAVAYAFWRSLGASGY